MFVLLPIQAIGAQLAACGAPMSHCPEQMQGMDCCDDEQQTPSDPACAAGGACMGGAAFALPTASALAVSNSPCCERATAVALSYRSFIADSAHPPPRPTA